MTQEEKQLLEIELSTRAQYGVICAIKPVTPFHDLGFCGKQKIKNIYIRENDSIFTFGPYEVHGVENIRPYLRPMKSMTEEEKKEYKSFFSIGEYSCGGSLNGEEYEYIADSRDDISQSVSLFDWLNAHHFDYRNWIEDGLALEAPEDMYKTE